MKVLDLVQSGLQNWTKSRTLADSEVTPSFGMGMVFAPDDEEYIKIPALPKDEPRGPKGIECGECGVRFDYGRFYESSCYRRRCPLQGCNRSATGSLFTP